MGRVLGLKMCFPHLSDLGFTRPNSAFFVTGRFRPFLAVSRGFLRPFFFRTSRFVTVGAAGGRLAQQMSAHDSVLPESPRAARDGGGNPRG